MVQQIKVVYDVIDHDVIQMSRLAERVQAIEAELNLARQGLDGEWVGYGAASFFQEIDNELLPGVQRLAESLSSASSLLHEIGRQFLILEQDRSGPGDGGDD